MPTRSRDADPVSLHEALLAQVGWIRRLARHLVQDHDLAEELVQETCVVALERRPDDLSKLRRWLASVMRNALRQRVRGDARRRFREVRSAQPEALEATDGLVERVTRQRELVEEVLGLGEPYRSTVLLRFFDDLPPRDIGRRLSVPVATVNSRLQRGLALLRQRLDRKHGSDGRGWVAALLPVLRIDLPTGTVLGGLFMKTKLAVALVFFVAAAGLVIWTRGEDPAAHGRRDGTVGVAVPPVLDRSSDAVARSEADSSQDRRALSERRAIVPPASIAAPVADTGAVQARALTARVLDGLGQPVPGVAIRSSETGERLGRSEGGGWLRASTDQHEERLEVDDDEWVTVHVGVWRANTDFDPVVIIAPAIDLAGRVEDESGRPLAGAQVRYRLPADFRTRFADVLDASSARSWARTSDEVGEFRLAGVPAIDGAAVTAVLEGYEAHRTEAPLFPHAALRLVLGRPSTPETGSLTGRVVDPDAAAVPGARVSLGLASVLADGEGAFEIDLSHAVTSELLTATSKGFLPARMERRFEPGEGTSGWPDHVVLELGGPALAIRGRVVDLAGEPVARAKIWLADPTPTGPIGAMPTQLEGLMAGAEVPAFALESQSRRPAADGGSFSDFVAPVGRSTAFWHWVKTGDDGGFVFPGLARRHYRLSVMAPDQLVIETSEPIRAGDEDVVIRLPEPDVYSRIAGAVVSRSGRPVTGVEVLLTTPVIDVTARVFGGRSQVVLFERGGTTTTDEQGRFRFDDVPREGCRLSLRADSIIPSSHSLSGVDSPRSLELVVEARCHLQVELRDPVDRFDALAVTDGEGRALDVYLLSGEGVEAYTDVPLAGGSSGVVSVSDEARQLLLLSEGEVVESVRLDLVPGEINRVRV